jgi:hypothetical protein
VENRTGTRGRNTSKEKGETRHEEVLGVAFVMRGIDEFERSLAEMEIGSSGIEKGGRPLVRPDPVR